MFRHLVGAVPNAWLRSRFLDGPVPLNNVEAFIDNMHELDERPKSPPSEVTKRSRCGSSVTAVDTMISIYSRCSTITPRRKNLPEDLPATTKTPAGAARGARSMIRKTARRAYTALTWN
jgi:hypothetical protein